METHERERKRDSALVILCSLLLLYGCGDDGTGTDEEQTGATLQGTVTVFDATSSAVLFAGMGSAQVPGVRVSIGTKETETDANGDFVIRDIPLGDRVVSFSQEDAVGFSQSTAAGTYFLTGIVAGATFTLDQVQVNGALVSTAHTGTWVGTGGSTDPGSQGQIALTMILEENGNSLTGTASVGSPDNSVWSVSGKETGTAVDGELTVVSSNSSCASGVSFEGTFSADTLSGTFVEVNPPAGCGSPESGTFRVVKQ